MCAVSLDYLVRGGQQRFGYGKAERLGGLEVDDELEFGRQHHRQVGRLLALEDSAGILTNLTVRPRDARAITNQPTDLDKFAPSVGRRQRMTFGKCDDFNAPVHEKRIGSDEERVGVLLDSRGKRRLQITLRANV